jgi:hypothetical protein
MTKIDGVSPGSQIVKNARTQKADTDLFKQTLDRALETKKGERADKAAEGGLKEITAPAPLGVEAVLQAFSHKTTLLLDLLDRFAEALGNPAKTLREVEPLVREMKAGADELLALAERDVPVDDPLRSIAVEGAMRANIETIKFNRGDYI